MKNLELPIWMSITPFSISRCGQTWRIVFLDLKILRYWYLNDCQFMGLDLSLTIHFFLHFFLAQECLVWLLWLQHLRPKWCDRKSSISYQLILCNWFQWSRNTASSCCRKSYYGTYCWRKIRRHWFEAFWIWQNNNKSSCFWTKHCIIVKIMKWLEYTWTCIFLFESVE